MSTITFSPYGSSGITVSYVKRRRAVGVYGWYDSFVGLEGGEMSLSDFLAQLGVSDADLRYVLRERAT